MATFKSIPFKRLALPLLVAVALAGCSALEVEKETVEKTDAARVGPDQTPFRAITGFTDGLRCMDNMMIEYGVRDISMLVEEILDQTKKVNAGTRDMLITAVSDMTRRSRAIRVNAFGKDATNAISFLASAQTQAAYDVIPPYDIKGSVSQFDENVIRNQKDAGFGFGSFIGLGIARDAASSILGLDLSVLTTSDLSVLPGVTSRNSVVILKQGSGFDGDAAYSKLGLNFSMTLSKSEGQAQALRGLVELAVIELMGKLTKTPYWRCLGADPTANADIKREISDWYFAMASSRVELIAWFQNQLRRRGYYDGPIDGEFNAAFDEATANYRAALGLEKKDLLDEAFFTKYLNTDHLKIPRPAAPAVAAAEPAPSAPPGAAGRAQQASAPATTTVVAVARPSVDPASAGSDVLKLALTSANNQSRFARAEPISLTVQLNRDAHVYCYLQDETSKITRFFPNRFIRDSLVTAKRPLAIPGSMRFQLVMNDKAVPETVACFATNRDVATELPPGVMGTDFDPLTLGSLDQIRRAFYSATTGAFAEETFRVQAK
ncbi:MAG: DUF4384 domain-containing protein [Burkholderiales bacterium]